MMCCICGQSTSDVVGDEYVEVGLTFPLSDEPFQQWLGAHRECMAAALAPGFDIYGPMAEPPIPLRRPRVVPVASYDRDRGVVADVEGGHVTVEHGAGRVAITGDDAGLRDLARWLLALSDPEVPNRKRVALTSTDVPLGGASLRLSVAGVEVDAGARRSCARPRCLLQ